MEIAGLVQHLLQSRLCSTGLHSNRNTKEKAARNSKAVDLPVSLRYYPHLWSQTLGSDRKNTTAETSAGISSPQMMSDLSLKLPIYPLQWSHRSLPRRHHTYAAIYT